MTDASEIRKLAGDDIAAAGTLLSRAFYDNPGMVWGLPNAHKRSSQLDWVMTLIAGAGARYGQILGLGAPLQAVSVWYPPSKPSISIWEMLRVGLGSGPLALGLRDFGTLMRAMTLLEQQHVQAESKPHYYLHAIGVEPQLQRRGLGSRILKPMLREADEAIAGCYLETDKPEDVRFYEKHGFHVNDDFPLGPGGPTIWTMRRSASVPTAQRVMR